MYCDPCNPFKLVLIDGTINSKEQLYLTVDMAEFSKPSPLFVNVKLFAYRPDYDTFINNNRRTKYQVLKHISQFRGTDATLFQYLADSHGIENLLPKNVTIDYSTKQRPYERYMWKDLQTDSCDGSKWIRYHPNLRPIIELSPKIHLSSYQEVGLIFHKKRLRFLSCYKKRLHWVFQLQEMFTVFDYYTWFLIVFVMYATSRILNILFQQVSKDKRERAKNTIFQIYGIMLDQSSDIFQNTELRKHPSFCISFACVPMALMFLGNQYKGDNIVKLTLDPPLVPYDTFADLVQNKFKILVGSKHLSEDEFNRLKQAFKIKADYFRESKHESFPIVSELWYEIMQRWNIWNYLGKEIFNENLLGYKYWGYFPARILQMSKFYFQSGIQEWWQMYIQWFLTYRFETKIWAMQPLRVTESDRKRLNEFKSGDQIYGLCMIPLVCLLFSSIVFTCFEIGVRKFSFLNVRKMFGTFFTRIMNTFVLMQENVNKCLFGNPSLTIVLNNPSGGTLSNVWAWKN